MDPTPDGPAAPLSALLGSLGLSVRFRGGLSVQVYEKPAKSGPKQAQQGRAMTRTLPGLLVCGNRADLRSAQGIKEEEEEHQGRRHTGRQASSRPALVKEGE